MAYKNKLECTYLALQSCILPAIVAFCLLFFVDEFLCVSPSYDHHRMACPLWLTEQQLTTQVGVCASCTCPRVSCQRPLPPPPNMCS